MSEPLKSTEPASTESHMVINPKGARIESLILGERLVLKSVRRGDGREASSHPCTPIFGPETNTTFGLPQHGLMRNELCTVIEGGPNLIILSHEIKAGTYPPGMIVEQTFALLGGNFTLKTIHTNNGREEAPVNFGEHFYWAAPNGWEGLRINGGDVTDAVKNGLVVPLRATNQIVIPGLPEIILEQEGLPVAVLWVYRDPATGGYDRDYVCIEPVEGDPTKNFFGSPESLIAPGTSRTTRIAIRANTG